MSQDVTNCPQCARRTPAARGACIYCGAALVVERIEVAPAQKNIDPAEHAFNAILETGRARVDERAEAALASALQVEQDEARALIAATRPVPMARCQHRQEAELIAALIRTCGLSARVVADEDLRLEVEMPRARRITRTENELHVQHSGGSMTVPTSEIKLFVLGAIRNTRIDYMEGSSGMRKQAGGVLDAAEFRSEEMLLDVYSTSLERSFRIRSDAFDYSGLVQPMSFRAEINFQMMIDLLRALAPQALFDEEFARLRGLLARAWPERSHTEARGLKRTGLTYRPVAQASVTSNNRDQFERYSRLMFLSV
ncbi:MAG TPA: hypothetical protein VNO70_16950 [Blastocatellia bacterium]|nr:hypothetical protein [Blastocatellia bacterium]